MSRLAPIVVWCILILAGTVFLVWSRPGSAPTASRALPINTYLMPGDLSYPGYDGRYVVAPKGLVAGATLRPADVADQPSLIDGPHGRLLLLVNVDRAAVVGGLNAGSNTQLCGKPPTAYGGVTVQAVRCEADRTAPRCVAVIDLAKAIAAEVVAKALKDQSTTTELRLATKCD